MLIAVDVGNTQTVIGAFDGEARIAAWRLATRLDTSVDEFGLKVRTLLELAGIDASRVDGAILASVVPPMTPTLLAASRSYLGVEPLVVGPGIRTGMPIRMDHPQEIGADRIVNAVAAHHRFGGPVVVIDFGTATTFDVVSEAGEYLGGVIAPGVLVSAEALFERAARLPRVQVQRPARVVGRNTVHSLQAGLYHGYVALIEGLMARIREELKGTPRVVATGGLAHTFADDLAFLDAVEPDLTLEGLRLVYARNR
jgi:type III pantothenate kinase